uniref:MIF4G domain-containing protein n=1 Tax=viral metagenome TaxID=1070528 RepID=A0A6C0AZR1_9ZZZZ
MTRYTIDDFNKVLEEGLINDLPDETIKIINILANQVGSPEYIKTPQFKNKIQQQSNIRRRKKNLDFNDESWDTIRTFKTTEFEKKEGIDKKIQLIRKYFNMITYNTYSKLKDTILTEINTINQTDTQENFIIIINEIFKIASMNILYSDIYAKLYKELINNNSYFKDILLENLKNFEDTFNTINFCDPEKDYNKFCENNKNNEARRALCSFYINLMKEEIIEKNIISNCILNLFKRLDNYISDKNKINEIDELSEIIYIMIVNSYHDLNKSDPEVCKTIYNNIIEISKMKGSFASGISNKSIFKHMDILDEIS